MKATVTAKVRIPSDSRIVRTMEVYSKAVQFCVDWAWEMGITNRVELHDICYYKIKRIYGLQAQLCANAIKQAVEMVKGAKSKPEVRDMETVRYNFPRCASVKDWKVLSLSTIEGRVKVPIIVPGCYTEYLSWEVRESSLIYRKGKLFFCFVFAKEVSFDSRNRSQVVGVDLGINTLAVTSDGRFFKGIKHLRVKHERLVAEIQSKGTRASHRKIRKIGSRWKRFMTWVNHRASKEIVSNLKSGDVIVMEDLTHIRKSAGYNRWIHKWTFRQLQSFIEYKAVKKGVRVAYGNPKYTSKECCLCGSRDTFRHRGFFECKNCGFSLNADLNGARNIAQRYIRNFGLGSSKPAPNLMCDETKAVSDSLPNRVAV